MPPPGGRNFPLKMETVSSSETLNICIYETTRHQIPKRLEAYSSNLLLCYSHLFSVRVQQLRVRNQQKVRSKR
jgi:hypothetical protein